MRETMDAVDERGMVEHALRLVVAKSRKAYIYPATHYASALTGAQYPSIVALAWLTDFTSRHLPFQSLNT